MKYFGTDGIRGIIGKELNKSIITKIAKAIVLYYDKHKLKRILLVGNDSRISSDYISSTIESVLLKHGIEIHNIDICSSPCLAYLTREFNYPLGLMLSASHNPNEYNGIKFFNSLGEKVDDIFEEEFEYLMDKNFQIKKIEYTNRKNTEKLKENYINYLKKIKKFDFECIFDCANGGTSEIIKKIFSNCEIINHNPDGTNINNNAGCTHIERLQKLCIKKKKIGFAFDGDGDRIHIVSEHGEIINGDKILYILSKFFLQNNDSIVGTIYTNSGLEKSIKRSNINLIRAYVGDKNVYNEMLKNNSMIGGEESGHIIIRKYLNTGDGILTAIVIGNILKTSNLTIEELLSDYTEYYQTRANIKTTTNFSILEELKKKINELEKSGSKIIIRPSGTEPVIRLFVENKNKENAQNHIKILENLIKNQ